MEEEKKLYPFRFCTLEDKYQWGAEQFRLADLGYRDSVIRDGWLGGNSLSEVMDMYMDRVVGENVFEFFGRQFPVCVRNLSIEGKMPLRVHPSDELATSGYDFLGKEKLWYVRSAGKDSKIFLGFRRDVSASEVYEKCSDCSIEDILNVISPHCGQYFHIAPGVVHAAEGKLDIVEIAESSPLDFCLCDWGVPVGEEEFDASLDLESALEFINLGKYATIPAPTSGRIIDIPAFCVSEFKMLSAMEIGKDNYDTFLLYTCLEGSGNIEMNIFGQKLSFPFDTGETILVPAECPDFRIVPLSDKTRVLETTVPFREEKDSYLG